jgi:TonB family protein
MRHVAFGIALFAALGFVVPLQAQVQAPRAKGPSYDDVLGAPEASVGKTVSWVVRFTRILADIGPDGSVTRVRTLFEHGEAGGSWQGRGVIAPQPGDFKWPEPPYVDHKPQTQPRLLSGTIAAVEQTTTSDGRRMITPVLRNVTLELLPAESALEPGKASGVSWPAIVQEDKPRYTKAAMSAKIQGTVELKLTILPDGSVGDVRVTRSLDTQHGLDQAAIESAKRWRFKPGMKNGVPVPTIVTLVLEFRLK